MRILLLGKNGQVGWELERTLAPLGEVVALGRAEADLSQLKRLPKIVADVRPQVVVNAAAYTDVDRAETEPDQAMLVNATAPGVLAEEARKIGAALVHFSTNYVFDGTKGAPYVETDAPNPINTYGRSKLEGEQSIQAVGGAYLILRTGWVYGLLRESFVTKVLRWTREQEVVRIVEDQIGSPTWARMLAGATALLIAKAPGEVFPWLAERKGVYHLAGSGFVSRFEWAKLIMELKPKRQPQKFKEALPASTSEFSTPAKRPLFSALDCALSEETFGLRLPGWQQALQLAIEGSTVVLSDLVP